MWPHGISMTRCTQGIWYIRVGDRGPMVSLHKGSVTRQCFHLMTSSWLVALKSFLAGGGDPSCIVNNTAANGLATQRANAALTPLCHSIQLLTAQWATSLLLTSWPLSRTSRLPQDPAAWTSQAPSPGLTPAAASLSSTLPASPH